MTALLHLQPELGKQMHIGNPRSKSHRGKFRGRHLFFISVVIFPLQLCLTPIAATKIVVERLGGLLHLISNLRQTKRSELDTFTLRDPNLRILGFFSILLVLCFLLENQKMKFTVAEKCYLYLSFKVRKVSLLMLRLNPSAPWSIMNDAHQEAQSN